MQETLDYYEFVAAHRTVAWEGHFSALWRAVRQVQCTHCKTWGTVLMECVVYHADKPRGLGLVSKSCRLSLQGLPSIGAYTGS